MIVPGEDGRTLISTLALEPLAIVPSAQSTVPPDSEQLPCVGVVTDIETGPNGNLFVVGLSNGTVYEIFRP